MALQAVRHIVAPPVHYAAKLKLPVVTGEKDVGQVGGMVGLKIVSLVFCLKDMSGILNLTF